MDSLARSLHLSNRHFSEFSAHLHIQELYQIPLSTGECRVKWKFKGSMHINNKTTDAIVKTALDARNAPLEFLRSLNPSHSHKDNSSDAEDSHPEKETKKHGLAGIKDAFLHTVRRPRSTSSSRETVTHEMDDSEDDRSYFGNHPNASLISPSSGRPESPRSLAGASVSRTMTVWADSTPMAQDTVRANPESITDNNNQYEPSEGKAKSIMGGPEKAEAKGTTDLLPVSSKHACSINKQVLCAVQIPIDSNSGLLSESSVVLSVRHRVRTTPEWVSEWAAYRRKRKGTATGTNSGYATPTESVTDLSSITSISDRMVPNEQEEYEEIKLGEVNLDLSEFVSRTQEGWVTRRYLLQSGKTNALLRVSVKMIWIGGQRVFSAPPLRSGQIKATAKFRDRKHRSIHHSGLRPSNASQRSLLTIDMDNRSEVPSSASSSSGEKSKDPAEDDGTTMGRYFSMEQDAKDLIGRLFEQANWEHETREHLGQDSEDQAPRHSQLAYDPHHHHHHVHVHNGHKHQIEETGPTLIRIPTHVLPITTKVTDVYKPPSPTKTKRPSNLPAEFPSDGSSLSRSNSSTNLLRRPFLGSRKSSLSSLRSVTTGLTSQQPSVTSDKKEKTRAVSTPDPRPSRGRSGSLLRREVLPDNINSSLSSSNQQQSSIPLPRKSHESKRSSLWRTESPEDMNENSLGVETNASGSSSPERSYQSSRASSPLKYRNSVYHQEGSLPTVHSVSRALERYKRQHDSGSSHSSHSPSPSLSRSGSHAEALSRPALHDRGTADSNDVATRRRWDELRDKGIVPDLKVSSSEESEEE